jgi:predicted hydrocarbon binding protein
MCAVVRGVIRGLGERCGESFHIDELQCMHDGARECIFNVSRIH